MNLAFIGLGRMGGPMARHLAATENQLRVYDVVPDAVTRLTSAHAGVGTAASFADLVHDADVVFASLPGPPDVEAVVLGPGGLRDSMKPGAIYVDLTTNSPEMARRASTGLAEKGIAMLDAPVSGGLEGATAGTLGIMCGGERETFDQVEALLNVIGAKIVTAAAPAPAASSSCATTSPAPLTASSWPRH